MLTIVGMSFFLIFRFMNKYKIVRAVSLEDERRILLDLHQIARNPSLLEDDELNKKIYSEIDIAEHAIMLKRLPQDMSN
jgi:hypothetical protein